MMTAVWNKGIQISSICWQAIDMLAQGVGQFVNDSIDILFVAYLEIISYCLCVIRLKYIPLLYNRWIFLHLNM